ncbi:hypothetical protein, partial [Photorhabdus australis]|uniref:hypothetical protein n=1 Tax=Photorhabdus australis TaxID=286156 RepID=UPI00196A1C4A
NLVFRQFWHSLCLRAVMVRNGEVREEKTWVSFREELTVCYSFVADSFFRTISVLKFSARSWQVSVTN